MELDRPLNLQSRIAGALAAHFRVDDNGRIDSDFASYPEMRRWVFAWAEGQPREVVAASVQKVLEDFILKAVGGLLQRHGLRRIGLSGGVFANVKLNQRLAEELPVDEVFIYPAMSDQGLAAGGVLQHLLERDGLETWLSRRYRLDAERRQRGVLIVLTERRNHREDASLL